jgi:lantibiotic leader peptide-processing serine protease
MSSPNVAGVAALTLSAHPELLRDPSALVARLTGTTRKDMTNDVGPNDPANFASSLDGRPCATGYCHVDQTHPVGFSDAYGAGIVDAAASVGP